MLPLGPLRRAGEGSLLNASVDVGAVGTCLGVEDLKIRFSLEVTHIPQPAGRYWFRWPAGARDEHIGLRCDAQHRPFQPTDVPTEQPSGLFHEAIGKHCQA
jgi:hypothetical protein